MKAIVYDKYGPAEVLTIKDIQKPMPGSNEILIKVQATTVNYGDITARNFANIPSSKFNMPLPLWLPARMMFGFRKPKKQILGSEFSGEVESVGSAVTQFKKGDPVFGYRGQNMGAYSEFLCVPEKSLVTFKPANVSFDEAATIPYGALMALNLLRTVDLRKGQQVLINGASGAIGAAAVQLARLHYGTNVTGVCGTNRMEYVRALGAETVIDYTKEDFTTREETYDLVFDILGRSSFAKCKKVLKHNGRYLLASFKTKQLLQMIRTKFIGDKKVICALSPERIEDLILIKEFVGAGKIKSIIDKKFSLEQAADAHRYYENGHAKGKVVISLNHK